MQAYGVALGDKSLPSAIAQPAAAAIAGAWTLLHLPGAPPLTRHAIDLMCSDCTLDTRKIERELDYRPVVSVADGLRRPQGIEASKPA